MHNEIPRQPWDSSFDPHDPMESASEYLMRMRIGSKTYSDVTVATGVLPLPERSPLEV